MVMYTEIFSVRKSQQKNVPRLGLSDSQTFRLTKDCVRISLANQFGLLACAIIQKALMRMKLLFPLASK